MCGRYVRQEKIEELLKILKVQVIPRVKGSYNIAPSQMVACVRNAPENGHRECVMLKWGLIPSWAKDSSIGNKMINARAETVAEKPAFRSAFKKRRCLILAHGFYEWKREGKIKQPHYIRFKDHRPFAFAGLWERWEKQEPAVESCAIITTQPNDLMKPIHDRMPVILGPQESEAWLNTDASNVGELSQLLKPIPSTDMEAVPVSLMVNNPRNDSAQCMEPV